MIRNNVFFDILIVPRTMLGIWRIYIIRKSLCDLFLIGEFLQIRALKMANKEKGACEKIFKLFLYVQMIYWPLEVLFITCTDWVHPLDEIVNGEWLCDAFFFIKYSAWHIIVFHSFIIALLCYMFVIHHQFVDAKGKENFKIFFFWIIILVSMVTTTWKYFGNGELDSDPYLNKCRGKYHMEFLRFQNAMEGVKGYCDREYDLDNFSSHLTAMVKKISCIASSLVRWTAWTWRQCSFAGWLSLLDPFFQSSDPS